MNSSAPTPHNSAALGDIASTVIMPGDPKRAKYIADNFLENAVCFNEVRGMLGYTGTYKGKRISVMGSGMCCASMGIYAYELYKFYNVDRIVRIGSCGSFGKRLKLLDTFLVNKVFSEGNFALTLRNSEEHIIEANKELNEEIIQSAKKLNIDLKCGNGITCECFDWYIDKEKMLSRIPKDFDYEVVEMEAYALFNTAEHLKKEAACLLTVVDSNTDKASVSSEDREKSLNDMILIALETATNKER